MLEGGEWSPATCHVSNCTRVAIITPFRNRVGPLRVFLYHMHSFLQQQQIHYKIYIVNQADGDKFNRGMLLNVGYREALLDQAWDCFIFHDVDLLPEVGQELRMLT